MAWKQAIHHFLSSGPMLSMAGGMIATGSYVAYKDSTRFPRMMKSYSTGKILAPLAENDCEVVYVHRPELEEKIRKIFSRDFTNEYYLVYGPPGSGKTRTIIEVIRNMIKTDGEKGLGAPIYVLTTQGKSFPETLASAVNFYFDEHVSYAFFLDFVMRVHSFPSRDDHNRLVRVLDAVERSAFEYMNRDRRPVVIVVDGINHLVSYMPGALEKLQDKAKLWADANIAKVVFVTNDDEMEALLQRQPSSWARAATPVVFADLSKSESVDFLSSAHFMENSPAIEGMPPAVAAAVVERVGGLVHHLIFCKRNYIQGIPFAVTFAELAKREREKFMTISRNPTYWKVVTVLRNAPNKTILLTKLIKETSEEAVKNLSRQNVIRYRRSPSGTVVKFQSRLTENVVDDMERIYVEEKSLMNLSAAAAIADDSSSSSDSPSSSSSSPPSSSSDDLLSSSSSPILTLPSPSSDNSTSSSSSSESSSSSSSSASLESAFVAAETKML